MKVRVELDVDMVSAADPASILSNATTTIEQAFWREPAITNVIVSVVAPEEEIQP